MFLYQLKGTIKTIIMIIIKYTSKYIRCTGLRKTTSKMTQANGILISLITNELFVAFLEKLKQLGREELIRLLIFLRDML